MVGGVDPKGQGVRGEAPGSLENGVHFPMLAKTLTFYFASVYIFLRLVS